MEPCKICGTTNPFSHAQGLEGKEYFSFRSREKNILDFSSYRSGFFANHRAEMPPTPYNCNYLHIDKATTSGHNPLQPWALPTLLPMQQG